MSENVKKISKTLSFPAGVPPVRISLHEIARNLQAPQEILGWESVDDSVLSFLWKAGMDIDKEIGVDICNVRDDVLANTRTQIVLVGFERSDNEWVALRKSSLQATIGRNRDPWFRADLYNAACIPMNQVEEVCKDSGNSCADASAMSYFRGNEEDFARYTAKRKELQEILKVMYNIDLVEIE